MSPFQTIQLQLPLRIKPKLKPRPKSKSESEFNLNPKSSLRPEVIPKQAHKTHKPKRPNMCSTVLFTYRCGCTHTTTFECPDTASTFSSLVPGPSRSGLNHPHPHPRSCSRSRRCRRRQRCYGPETAPTTTPLDEDCFDCAQKCEETSRRAASLSDVDISSLSLSRDTDAESESDLDTAVVSMSLVLSTRASSPLDETILKERDPNVPSRCPLVSVLDLDLDLRMQLMDLDLLEESHGSL